MLQVWKEHFENLVILFDFLKEAFYSYSLTALPPFPHNKQSNTSGAVIE